jgi:gliding motility-associated-like protein
MKKQLLAFLLLFSFTYTFSQNGFWSNAGALVSIKDTSFLSVIGDMYNSNGGHYNNSDSIFVTGDWSNTAGNHAFDSIDAGYVYMWDKDQRIKGTDETYFYNLILKNQGVKYADLDAKVDGFLDMTDREFSVDTNTIWVRNPLLNSVRRTSGYLSSLKDGGLLRYTEKDSIYVFPVGSKVGTFRYRPIEMTPTSSQKNQFKVRFANFDATTEGYDRSIRFHLLCQINPNWYHRIYHPQGTDSAELAIFYDPAADGQWNDIAHWQNQPRWEAITKDAITAGSPFTKMNKLHWPNYNFSPFALAISSPPFANAGPDDSICSGAAVMIGASPDTNHFYNWTPGFGLNDSTLSNPIFSTTNLSTSNVVYPITVVASYIGCTDTDRVNVTVYPKTIVNAGKDASVCSSEEILLGEDARPGYTYNWSPPDGLSGTTISNPVFSKPNLGSTDVVYTYTLLASQNGCPDSAKVSITVYPKTVAVAGVDTIIWQYDTIQFLASGGNAYNWTPNYNLSDASIANPLAHPEKSTIYYVTVTDKNECSSYDSLYVLVRPKPFSNFFIPDVITPNGDGINDYWHIRDLERYPDNTVRIINRWGDEILNQTPYQQNWYGTWKDKDLPGATYYYVIHVKNEQGVEAVFNGPLTVVR